MFDSTPSSSNAQEDLAPLIPIDAFSDVERLAEGAARTLVQWKARYLSGHHRVAALAQLPSAPSWWSTKARILAEEAYRAGLRLWVAQASTAPVPIASPRDLRGWCALQFEVLAECWEAGPAHLLVPLGKLASL